MWNLFSFFSFSLGFDRLFLFLIHSLFIISYYLIISYLFVISRFSFDQEVSFCFDCLEIDRTDPFFSFLSLIILFFTFTLVVVVKMSLFQPSIINTHV